jgi:hypothetical protein
MLILRVVATCATQRLLTKDSELPLFRRFGNLLPSYPLLGLIFAGITLAMLSGCGGSSGSPAVVTPVTAVPSISPGTGTYTGTQQVTISDTSAGAVIYYTTNGMAPTTSSSTYTGPISISVTSTVEAIAVVQATSSAVATAVLTINPANPPAKLAFVQQPSNALAGVAISPAVQVAVEDASGNALTSATNPVTVALTSGTGLAGTLTVTPQNGVATFSNLTLSTAGSYMLSATSSGLTSATSASFTITLPPVKLAFTVQPSNGATGAAISPAVQVAIEDASGNTVTAATNPVTVALSGGSGLAGTLTVTPQGGIASFSNLTVRTAGSYMLTATSPKLTSATSTSFTITLAPVTYYLSPNGNDADSGLSASEPWLTPNHPVNCGDVIMAASGTYSNENFYTGKWGTVTCAAGNNVAWLECAAFDTCKIDATNGNQGMWVDQSYWGVQGWEVTTSASDTFGTCFIAQPSSASPAEIHHIIFANNIANGCSQGGFGVVNNNAVSVDYFVAIGNIAYNAVQGTAACGSGISVFTPVQSDSLPGTHIYVAGNFSYGNLEPSQCAGGGPTDGEGIIFDTFDGSQGGPSQPYTAQAVAENNIVVGNGGRGIEVLLNSAGTSHAAIYITQNTSWGNLTDPNQIGPGCGEITLKMASNTKVSGNLIATSGATGCGGNPIYPLSVENGDSTDTVDSNFAYGYNNNNDYVANSGTFAYGSKNVFGTNPAFSNPTVPGAPSCQSASNVANCMAPIIANFVPTASTAKGFGYQTPSSTPASDPLFPQWLCTVKLPAGLVTSGCTP